VYVFSQRSLSTLGLVPGEGDFAWVQGNATEGIRRTGGAGADAAAAPAAPSSTQPLPGGTTVQGLPLVKPPYGSMNAIDLNRGEILWKVAHGDTPDNIRNHPLLRTFNTLGIPRTGRPGVIGNVVTKTLVIAGEAGFVTTPQGRGAMLRAYNKATGAEAGAVYMPAPQTGSPMTYMWNGRQYIVVAIGGQGFPAELIAYRLPN
jgi:quinoprotein glucose dehydrogenase